MATVSASGSVWSAIYLDHASCKGDQEGFLIGEVVREVTTSISDSQISGKTEKISINVYSHHSCTEPFSFYDRKGHVDQVRLLAMLKDNYKNVVGWYQMRRNVPLEPTLRDMTLHHQLLKTLRNVSANTFFLGLFSSNMTSYGAIHNMFHHFLTITNDVYTALPLCINNLGETAQTEYRHAANAAMSSTNSTYSQILNSFKSQLLHPGGTVDGVQKVHLLNDTIHDRLKSLTGNVGESEENLQRLTDEVNDLERRAQRQRREQQALAASRKPQFASVVPQPSSSGIYPASKSSPSVSNQSSASTAPSSASTVPSVPHKAASSHASGDSKFAIKQTQAKTKTKTDNEVAMDTAPAPSKPDDPFAGLLADMKSSIQKAPSFKKSPTKGSFGSGSSSDEGPRTDRAQSFPQNNSDVESARGHQTRSSSLGQVKGVNSGNVNSGSDAESDVKSPQRDDAMGMEEDDDATQLDGDFQYTQSGSPTF